MNKRQLKKFSKKGSCKSWYTSRYTIIGLKAAAYPVLLGGWMPHNYRVDIKDSKRGNLKHPLEISILNFDYSIPVRVHFDPPALLSMKMRDISNECPTITRRYINGKWR